MPIRVSYNKYTDTHYVYDVTYVWDEVRQKKVPKQKCIGHVDPETGEIVPNGKRGRPRQASPKPKEPQNEQPEQPQDAVSTPTANPVATPIRFYQDHDLANIAEHVEHIDNILTQLSKGLHHLGIDMDRIESSSRWKRTRTYPSEEPQNDNQGMLSNSNTPSVETSPEG